MGQLPLGLSVGTKQSQQMFRVREDIVLLISS
jgi:hypothetical protein